MSALLARVARTYFPPIVRLLFVWMGAGAWLVMAIDPHNPTGWRVAWGVLDLAHIAVGFWMLNDFTTRNA